MHPDIEDLKPKLKEILYDCAVNIRATKAALYLYDGTSRFELVTEYGFRGGVRNAADFNDPIVDRCGRGRTPFYVNGLAAEPRFSQILYDAATDRLLAAPLYSRGKLIGFVDMRDKAGKQPFDNEDLPKAQSIADRLVEVFGEKNIFGHRFISLSTDAEDERRARPQPAPPVEGGGGVPAPAPSPAPAPVPTPPPPAAPRPPAAVPPPPVTARTHIPRMASVIIDARAAAGRILVPSSSEGLTDAELVAARDVLRAILLLPGAVAATFSAFGHMGGVQEIATRTAITDEARNLIQSKFNVWLTKRGEAAGYLRTSVNTLGAAGSPLTAADIQKVFTAPIHAGALRGLYLTVVFAGNPDRGAHELLAVLHNHLQLVLEQSLLRGTAAAQQTRIAEKLVEPDFAKYPDLRRHSERVAQLCESFARHLGLPPAEVDTARLAGLVHDCGLRLLDYDRLYRKPDLTAEELAFLREHPSVSAALIEPVLGPQLARIVLCHHERFDGTGYPNNLAGDEIPLLSRMLSVCDAWLAMTDPETYQTPVARDVALASLTRAAGAQFDGGLVGRFGEMVRAGG
ncbi:MAG TPA: HD domain-containing phosphohydrolase [Thermoanaerobaculia bacterium]